MQLFVIINKKWNKDKCRCDCKELTDKGTCDKGYIWNPSNCECESDKSCNIGECLDYKNCKCSIKLTDKLIDECTETIEEMKLANITFTENENNYECGSCIDDDSFYNFYWNYCLCLFSLLLLVPD